MSLRSNYQPMASPGELDFLEVLGIEPVEAKPGEGLWVYQLTDADGVMLRFSFSIYDRSVQAVLSRQGQELGRISQEGAQFLSLTQDERGPVIRATFQFANAHSDLEIRTAPGIRLTWATLVDRE